MPALKQASSPFPGEKDLPPIYSGTHLRGMVAAGARWLERSSAEIDALNVFPVPDGDTGTNMVLTMRSTLEEAESAGDSVAAVAGAMAKGALMGARGNSGVILSQFLRGVAKELEGKDTFTPADFAAALSRGATFAYQGLSRPVEGTILTVIRETAEAAGNTARNADLVSLLEVAVDAAAGSVARTPTLLPVLRQAGVVDAGGQGFLILLEGGLHFLKGEAPELARPRIIAPAIPIVMDSPVEEEASYGYCTEFLVKGEGLDPDQVRRQVERRGKSVVVVGDQSTVKVHIHTFAPGDILRYAVKLGSLHEIQIRNMDDQHRRFEEVRRAAAARLPIATVAVTWGEGVSKVFHSLGVTALVPGGRTMNPSTRELLRAVEAVPSEQVIILPNNKNVIPTAEQVVPLTKKKVGVVPTESLPQGIAALLALNPEAPPEENLPAMERAAKSVTTLEITRAVRSTRIGGVSARKGHSIALRDGELIAAAPSPQRLIAGLLPRLEKAELVTIYTGADGPEEQTQEIAQLFRDWGAAEVQVLNGGQPFYDYIISLE